jgi:hypothetical protein
VSRDLHLHRTREKQVRKYIKRKNFMAQSLATALQSAKLYNMLLRFLPVEEIAELAEGPAVCLCVCGSGEEWVLICLELKCDKVSCT